MHGGFCNSSEKNKHSRQKEKQRKPRAHFAWMTDWCCPRRVRFIPNSRSAPCEFTVRSSSHNRMSQLVIHVCIASAVGITSSCPKKVLVTAILTVHFDFYRNNNRNRRRISTKSSSKVTSNTKYSSKIKIASLFNSFPCKYRPITQQPFHCSVHIHIINSIVIGAISLSTAFTAHIIDNCVRKFARISWIIASEHFRVCPVQKWTIKVSIFLPDSTIKKRHWAWNKFQTKKSINQNEFICLGAFGEVALAALTRTSSNNNVQRRLSFPSIGRSECAQAKHCCSFVLLRRSSPFFFLFARSLVVLICACKRAKTLQFQLNSSVKEWMCKCDCAPFWL